MSVYLINEQTLFDIADAIREKNGGSERIFVSDMASEIRGIKSNGKLTKVIDKTVTELTAEDLQGATVIGRYAFAYCASLEQAVIPDGVTVIGEGAFEQCYGMTYLEIPASVTCIEYNAFFECVGMQILRVKGNTPPVLEAGLGDMYQVKIVVDAGCGNIFKSATNWCDGVIVEEGEENAEGWLIGNSEKDGVYITGFRNDLPSPLPNRTYTLFVNGEEIQAATSHYNEIDDELSLSFNTEDYSIIFFYLTGMGWGFSPDSGVQSGTVSIREVRKNAEEWLIYNQYIEGFGMTGLPEPLGGVSYTLFVDGEEIATSICDNGVLDFSTEDYRVRLIYDPSAGPNVDWYFHPMESEVQSGIVSIRING